MTDKNLPSLKKEIKWWSFNLTEIFDRLSSSKKGLTDQQVLNKREKFSSNILPSKEGRSLFQIFIWQFKSIMIVVLLIAAFLAFLLGDLVDAVIILVAVFLNVLVGFYQEYQTARSLAALRKVVISFAKVIRGGNQKIIKSELLVPGDVVILSAGDKVPADLRLFETVDLKIKEASLTGESHSAAKENVLLDTKTVLAERQNMAFMGTVVVQGHGKGVVVETGLNTAIGRIAELVATVKEEGTPLQKRLNRFAVFLTRVILGIILMILFFGLLAGHSFKEMFVTAIAVAVSAIPEGLAITMTVVLTVGMRRILKKKALVKQLLGAEILGSTSVICVDKTGTLTQGNMHIVKLVTFNNQIDFNKNSPQLDEKSAAAQMFLLRIGMLCNNAYIADKKDHLKIDNLVGDLTERALFLAASQVGLEKNILEKQTPRLDEIPFNSSYKFMMTLHRFDDAENIIYLKGAPEKVLIFSDYIYTGHQQKHLKLDQKLRQHFVNEYENLSKNGLRVLAIAYKKIDKTIDVISDKKYNQKISLIKQNNSTTDDQVKRQLTRDLYTAFVFVGLVGIKDPVRDNVQETIELTKSAGLKSVMITGDNKFTAKVIAQEVGLTVDKKNILDGSELDKMSLTEFEEKVTDITVYSRTTPEQKLKIIKAWQDKGEVVAMTGDGINDAPALKQANIGIALGTATDVAKESSDLILLDNNFKTIIEAVRQGRIIFENIKKIILYFVSDSFTAVTIILLSLAFGWPLPLLASQIIWINLVNDIFPAMALTSDPENNNVMKKKPIRKDLNFLDKEAKILILIISLIGSLFVISSFWFFWRGQQQNLDLARTIAFSSLAVYTLLYVFSIRNLSVPVWQSKIFNNKLLIAAVLFGFILQNLAVYNSFLQKFFYTVPLSLRHWLFILFNSLMVILIIELVKWLYNKHFLKNKS